MRGCSRWSLPMWLRSGVTLRSFGFYSESSKKDTRHMALVVSIQLRMSSYDRLYEFLFYFSKDSSKLVYHSIQNCYNEISLNNGSKSIYHYYSIDWQRTCIYCCLYVRLCLKWRGAVGTFPTS